jgi:hypothetical protein
MRHKPTELSNIRIGYSMLDRSIKLARFGKDQTLALEVRDATNDFYRTLVASAFNGKLPEIGDVHQIDFGGGDENFKILIERV